MVQLVAKRRISDDVGRVHRAAEPARRRRRHSDRSDPGGDRDPARPVGRRPAPTGRRVYSINPMAVARYRERHTVARTKSDHVDAMTLANILRTDAHAHRPMPADSELVQAIAVLARAHQDAIWRRSRAVNELRSLLREYYPGFLELRQGRPEHACRDPTPARCWRSRRHQPSGRH